MGDIVHPCSCLKEKRRKPRQKLAGPMPILHNNSSMVPGRVTLFLIEWNNSFMYPFIHLFAGGGRMGLGKDLSNTTLLSLRRQRFAKTVLSLLYQPGLTQPSRRGKRTELMKSIKFRTACRRSRHHSVRENESGILKDSKHNCIEWDNWCVHCNFEVEDDCVSWKQSNPLGCWWEKCPGSKSMLTLATKDTRAALSEISMLYSLFPACLHNPNLKKKKEKNLGKSRAGPMPIISGTKVFGVYIFF